MNLNQVTLPVKDMEMATGFYREMGFLQIVDTPRCERFECPEDTFWGARFGMFTDKFNMKWMFNC